MYHFNIGAMRPSLYFLYSPFLTLSGINLAARLTYQREITKLKKENEGLKRKHQDLLQLVDKLKQQIEQLGDGSKEWEQ